MINEFRYVVLEGRLVFVMIHIGHENIELERSQVKMLNMMSKSSLVIKSLNLALQGIFLLSFLTIL